MCGAEYWTRRGYSQGEKQWHAFAFVEQGWALPGDNPEKGRRGCARQRPVGEGHRVFLFLAY
jgi:hypothetical protein